MSARRINTKGRRKNRKRRSGKWETIFGNLLLEVIAVVALVLMLNVSKNATAEPPQTADTTLDRTAEYGSFMTGFLSDQWEQTQFFSMTK